MIYFNEVTGENTQEQNPYWSRVPDNPYRMLIVGGSESIREDRHEQSSHWPQASDHPYRTLMVGGFGSGKINALLSITDHQANIYKILLYAKNPY